MPEQLAPRVGRSILALCASNPFKPLWLKVAPRVRWRVSGAPSSDVSRSHLQAIGGHRQDSCFLGSLFELGPHLIAHEHPEKLSAYHRCSPQALKQLQQLVNVSDTSPSFGLANQGHLFSRRSPPVAQQVELNQLAPGNWSPTFAQKRLGLQCPLAPVAAPATLE